MGGWFWDVRGCGGMPPVYLYAHLWLGLTLQDKIRRSVFQRKRWEAMVSRDINMNKEQPNITKHIRHIKFVLSFIITRTHIYPMYATYWCKALYGTKLQLSLSLY